MDEIKLYQATAMAAKLAGKNTQITYTASTCNNGTSHNILNSITVMP
jgi:hypothetical protein